MEHSTPQARPTHTRWTILTLLFLISIITYIDRVNISITARHMIPALGLSHVEMGYVFSAFVLGYALCQIPGGWLGDRWGARRVLTLAIAWWSLFTALTALAPTLSITKIVGIGGSLMLVRFLIGVGEAAALPNFNRAIANWFSPGQRGLGIAITISGIGVGSALTPPLTAWIMVNYGWQMAFYLAGLLGLIIAALWYSYATDHPQDHPHVNAQELELIHGACLDHPVGRTRVPWHTMVRTPTVWWLIFSYTCFGYVAYVYMSWFYLYLVEERGFDVLRGAFFASSPFISIALLCPLGGWTTDRLTRRYGINAGRRWVGGAGMGGAATAILVGAMMTSPLGAILWLSLGAGLLYFTIGAFWSSTTDLSKSHAGTLSGLINTGANLGGTVSPSLTPWLADQFGWTTSLVVAAAVTLCGALAWLKIRPGDGLDGGENS